jgi:hypothetical protein
MSKTIHFFTTKPTELRDPSSSGRNPSPGDDQFYGENPSSLAKIVYFLNKRHTFGKMSIEVYDQNNTLLQELPAGKSAGINVVEMTANRERPRVPPSDTRESIGGSIVGPNLPAGTYKAKVIKGKEEFWTTFTLKNPEQSQHTVADRQLQQDATMRLYRMSERLAYLYDAQVNLIEQANAVKNSKLAKTIDPFIKEIEAVNATIVFKGGDFYVATEERLIERVAELYGQVNGYPGKPGASQLERIKSLEQEVGSIETKFKEFSGAKLEKVNSTLAKAKLNPIKVRTEEEFRSKPKSGSSAGTYQQFKKLQMFPQLF